MATDDLAVIVLDEFEKVFGWAPDDLDIGVADYLARAVCARLDVPVPSLAFPVPYAEFAAAVGQAGSAAPEAKPEGLPEVCSGGGPILAVPRSLAAQWRGTDTDDYDRACAQTEHYTPTEYGGLDWVAVGGGRALVLDLELLTTVRGRGDQGLIARNFTETPTEAEFDAWVSAADGWKVFPGELVLDDGVLVLFDSAVPGADDPDAIESDEGVATLTLEPGAYRVEVAGLDGMDLIRLTRA